MGYKILVCGGKSFSDYKLLHRALDAVHRKHHISCLITGEQKGAEEMAYFWAVSRRIAEIITVPATPDMIGKLCRERRAKDLLVEYEPDAVVAFPSRSQDAALWFAKERGFKVWEVPKNY